MTATPVAVKMPLPQIDTSTPEEVAVKLAIGKVDPSIHLSTIVLVVIHLKIGIAALATPRPSQSPSSRAPLEN